MKKLDYEFWKDGASIVSYLLFAISVAGLHFFPRYLLGISIFCCAFTIILCAFKMFKEKRNG